MSGDVDLVLQGAEALVREICAAEGIDESLIRRLIAIERDHAGMMRRRGVQDAIDAALGEEMERGS
jgi:hypothetical protein